MLGLNGLRNIALAAVLSLAAGAAGAATATCSVTDADGHPVSSYTVSGTDSAGCYAWGNGNINGNPTGDPLLTGSNTVNGTITPVATPYSDLTYLGAPSYTQVTGSSTVSGTIDIGTLGDGYTDLVLAIKFGDNWASFMISAEDNPFSYSITPKRGAGVSHMGLYGVPAPVPLPAAGLMLLGALGGLTVVKRRRKA